MALPLQLLSGNEWIVPTSVSFNAVLFMIADDRYSYLYTKCAGGDKKFPPLCATQRSIIVHGCRQLPELKSQTSSSLHFSHSTHCRSQWILTWTQGTYLLHTISELLPSTGPVMWLPFFNQKVKMDIHFQRRGSPFQYAEPFKCWQETGGTTAVAFLVQSLLGVLYSVLWNI